MKKIVFFVALLLYSSSSYSAWDVYNFGPSCIAECNRRMSELDKICYCHFTDNALVTYLYTWVERNDGTTPCSGDQVIDIYSGCVDPGVDDCANTATVNGSTGWINETCFPPVTDEDYSDCSTVSGNACYSTPDSLDEQPSPEDYVCGTFNGQDLCVSSITSDAVGSSNQQPGTTSETLPATTSTQTIGGTETTTTITSETTTTTTTETTPLTGGPESVADGAGIDPGAGNIAPAVCENGQYASTLNACDTTTVCPQTHYVDAGVCLPLPTQSVVSETTETTTTTTVVNNTTGQEEVVVSQGTTQQTLPPQNAPQQKIELDVQFEFSGPCDPSMTNYYECMDLESTMPAHTVTDNADYDGAAISAYERINNAPIVQSFSALGSIIPSGSGSCPVVSIDLADTLINRVITTSIHCDAVQSVAPAISAIMIVVWLVLAAFLFGRA